MLLIGMKTELDEADTINKIFDLLTCYCASFINFQVFQLLAKHFCIESDDEIMKYPEHLEAYINLHKISEFIIINPALKKYRGESGAKLVFKFDIENTCKLARISELQAAVAKVLNLQASTLQLLDITKGCVMVTFLIPTEVADIIFVDDKQFTQEDAKNLRASSVKWLTCNGYKYDFSKDNVGGMKIGALFCSIHSSASR
jgi:hypothetical protein